MSEYRSRRAWDDGEPPQDPTVVLPPAAPGPSGADPSRPEPPYADPPPPASPRARAGAGQRGRVYGRPGRRESRDTYSDDHRDARSQPDAYAPRRGYSPERDDYPQKSTSYPQEPAGYPQDDRPDSSERGNSEYRASSTHDATQPLNQDDPTTKLDSGPDATVVMPALRNAPMAPPTPIPPMAPPDATMVMSAIPYFTPSATPSYTGTIYVSYTATRARLQEDAEKKTTDERKELARNSAIMAAGSIVSRITGFLRSAMLGAALGGAMVANTYATANTIPTMVYELLLGGLLTSVLVPQLVRARQQDKDGGLAYAQRLLTLAVLVLGGATALAVLAAPLLTAVMANEQTTGAARELMTSLAYLVMPMIFFFGFAGLLGAILNSRERFGAPMWTPILNNVVIITTSVVFMLITTQETLTPENITGLQVAVLGLGTLAGIMVQAFGLFPSLRKAGFRWRWRFDFRKLQLRELGSVGGWMLCYVVVSQLGVLVIVKLSYAAGGNGGPGPFIYNNAFFMFMMANGIVAVSISTALMPKMSAAANEGRYRDVMRTMSMGTRLVVVVLMPITGVYLVLGSPIANLLFGWGRYTAEQAAQTGVVIAVAGFALLPFAINQMQMFVFYALRDTKTAALINVPVVAVKVIVDVVLYYIVSAEHVAAALMFGNVVSYTVAAFLSGTLLRRRMGRAGSSEIVRTLVRVALAAAVAVVACLAALWVLNRVLGDGKISDFFRVALGGCVLLLVYLAAASAMRVREIKQVIEMVTNKFGRFLRRGSSSKSRSGSGSGSGSTRASGASRDGQRRGRPTPSGSTRLDRALERERSRSSTRPAAEERRGAPRVRSSDRPSAAAAERSRRRSRSSEAVDPESESWLRDLRGDPQEPPTLYREPPTAYREPPAPRTYGRPRRNDPR